jgi:hypothetical protein
MTVEQYWAEIHAMRLTPTKVSLIFMTADMQTQPVPNPAEQTPEQRIETIERLRFKLFGNS